MVVSGFYPDFNHVNLHLVRNLIAAFCINMQISSLHLNINFQGCSLFFSSFMSKMAVASKIVIVLKLASILKVPNPCASLSPYSTLLLSCLVSVRCPVYLLYISFQSHVHYLHFM